MRARRIFHRNSGSGADRAACRHCKRPLSAVWSFTLCFRPSGELEQGRVVGSDSGFAALSWLYWDDEFVNAGSMAKNGICQLDSAA